MKILLIDNNDSFTYNLAHLIYGCTNVEPEIKIYGKEAFVGLEKYSRIFISPGPGAPEEYPLYERIKDVKTPVTGICLGMQILNVLFGGKVERGEPVHGKVSRVAFNGSDYNIARYHSLYCSKVAECFDTITVFDGIPMIIQHKNMPYTGIQFHPESFMSEGSKELMRYVFYDACSA